MFKYALAALAATASIGSAQSANAAVVVNKLPTGPLFASAFTNNSYDQNFLVQFTLANATDINGFSLLGNTSFGSVGSSVRIKIRSDVNGDPALTNLYSFTDTIDTISGYANGVSKFTSNFAGVTLAAGTYWIGMSGEQNTFTWAAYNNGGAQQPTYQYQLSVDTLQRRPAIYDLAYQILGDPASAVPEPETWAMMMLGFGGMGYAMRRKSKVRTRIRFA